MESDRSLDRAVGHPQRIGRRLPPTDLLADGFLQVDDRAGLIHAGKLARRRSSGERWFAEVDGSEFPQATNAFSLRQTSSTFARELKAEIRKYPSPAEPKPEPGVMTTWASPNILSNMSHELRPAGQPTQT